jgi:hypothetical protein
VAVAMVMAGANIARAQMSVPGQFVVGSTGAASFTIPIAVPPGTAGMVPSLSLDYSSQSGDGIVGLGWALSGLPSMNRCPETMAQDGVHGNVNYNANDRFCLDGQRLIVISGTYGADGAEYRTEIESFTRILSHGTAGNGPAWFEVHSKSGQTLEFGNTPDSQVLALGTSTARNWALNQITDSKGNYLTVTYVNDTTNGQAYPSQITYTGNTSASLSPYNSVQFIYNTQRPDVSPVYQAGSLMQTTVLLTEIKTCAGSTTLSTCTGSALAADYKLGYQLGSPTASSRLTSVTQCDGNGDCLPPTNFTWQGSVDQVSFTAVANGLTQGSFINVGDFNGDGLTDVILSANTASCPSSGAVFLGTGGGSFTPANDGMCLQGKGPSLGTLSFTDDQVAVGDVNGDGKSDAIILHTAVTDFSVFSASFAVSNYLSSASGSSRQNSNLGLSNSSDAAATEFSLFSGDFNGDGLTDIILLGLGQTTIYLSNGNGNYSAASNLPWTGLPLPLIGDFDGDGCSDFLQANTTSASGGSAIYFSDCKGNIRTSAGAPNWNGFTAVLGDFNGDGKTDVLVVHPSQAGAMYLSTGTGLVQTNFAVPAGWGNFQVVVGDWNGDGKADIALISPNGGQHLIFLSTGTGFVQVATISNSDNNVTATAGDWNNDGATDLWVQKPSGDTQYIANYAPNLISQITTGLGETTKITYKPLTSDVYANGTGAAHPLVNVPLASIYVVAFVDADDGVDTTPYSTAYKYSSALSDLSGRGFLGFAGVTAFDLQTNITRMTSYNQAFPFLGLVAAEMKMQGSTLLNQTNDTYTATPLGGTHNQVILSKAIASSQDLDGSVIPSLTTTYQYDSFGNATQVVASMLDGTTKTTTNTYTNDTTNWFLGRLTASTVTSQIPSPSTPALPPVVSVTISSNQTNFNLWSYLVANGFALPGHAWDWNVTIASGVTIGASSTGNYAFDTGVFPSGSTLNITNNGVIEGAGGAGGSGGTSSTGSSCISGSSGGGCGVPGSAGGPAFHAQVPLTMTNNGSVWGGGGGGGGGWGGGGGGGGAGTVAGSAGPAGTNGSSGSAGSASAGGAGGSGQSVAGSFGITLNTGNGGAGGGPGQTGASGGPVTSPQQNAPPSGQPTAGGGGPGAAVVGDSNVTWATTGNVSGPLN